MINWQIYLRNERIAKNLKSEQETTKKKINAFLNAASTGKLWDQGQQTPSESLSVTSTAATPTRSHRQQTAQPKVRRVSIAGRTPTSTIRSRSALPPSNKLADTTRDQSDVKLDDFFQVSSPRQETDSTQRA